MAIGDTTDPGYKKAICSECGGEYDGRVDYSPKKTIKGTCSAKCSYHKKTGYWNPSQNPEVKAKKKASLAAHYGGPDGDYEKAKKAVAKKQAKLYKEKTGYVNPGQNPEVREKAKKTLADHLGNGDYKKATKVLHKKQAKAYKDKTGYDNPGQNPEVRRKVEKTVQERYGVGNVFQSDEIKEKIKSTMLEKYGVEYGYQNPEIFAKVKATTMKTYGVPYRVMAPDVKRKAGIISKTNLAWKSDLEDMLGVEFDLEVPFDLEGDHRMQADLGHGRVLIDLNPTISHNSDLSYMCMKGQCKGAKTNDHSGCTAPVAKNYHNERMKTAIANGFSLINVYDWTPRDFVIDEIRRRLGLQLSKISVDDVEIKRIEQKTANSFLKENSMQGPSSMQVLCYGLFVSNELIQVLTLRKTKASSAAEFELHRLATKLGVMVDGGYGLLFEAAREIDDLKSLVIDLHYDDLVDPAAISVLGFKKDKDLPSTCYWYSLKLKHWEKPIKDSALAYGIDKVLHRPAPDFPDYNGSFETSNEGLMLKEGYVRVYDAGGQRMIWRA